MLDVKMQMMVENASILAEMIKQWKRKGQQKREIAKALIEKSISLTPAKQADATSFQITEGINRESTSFWELLLCNHESSYRAMKGRARGN